MRLEPTFEHGSLIKFVYKPKKTLLGSIFSFSGGKTTSSNPTAKVVGSENNDISKSVSTKSDEEVAKELQKKFGDEANQINSK